MTRGPFKALLALGAALVLSGCASVVVLPGAPGERTRDGAEVLETVEISNSGWKLLCLLPIGSGDPEKPNRKTCRWCRDTVTLANQMRMLEAEVKRSGARCAREVTSYDNDEDVYLILFLRTKMHTSAVLVK